MKKLLFALIALALVGCRSAEPTADCGRHGMIDDPEWFIVQDITPADGVGKVWMISEHYHATCYVITGTKRAMLIDAGVGVGNLAGLVRSLTDLPLVVLNTHGHRDHVGADYQFTEIWLPTRDTAIYRTSLPLGDQELVLANAKRLLGDFAYDEDALAQAITEVRAYDDNQVILFDEGQTWDLGDKVIRAVALEGHTPGEMVFVDDVDDMLFSGDAMNLQLWMWMDHCLPMDVYAENLRKAIPEFEHLSRMYCGHELRPEGMPIEHAKTVLRDVEALLAGEMPEPELIDAPFGGAKIAVSTFDTWVLWAKP